MQPECSYPCSQQPATYPYPEPAQPTSLAFLPFFKSVSILSFHLSLGFQTDLFPHASPAYYLYFFPTHMPHAPPILTTRLDQPNEVCCAKHFMKLLILYFSLFPLRQPIFRTSSAWDLPLQRDTKFHTHTSQQAILQFCLIICVHFC
jgi:hypothetical protein